MTKLKVSVTENDIKKGYRGPYYDCPVERAFRRACKNSKIKVIAVNVQSEVIAWTIIFAYENGTESKSIKLNKKIGKWIETFDHEGKQAVKPIEFVVNLPNE